ncbi:MAG: exodeoxyribonuclease VII large subunit [Desulfobacterales bacterium]|nr:exodeoxyribonuclease VII large subunit [Desulfobacterales bacterium]
MPDPFDDSGDFIAGGNPDAGSRTRTILSVSELTRRIRTLLENNFPFVWVCGEVSNLRIPGSGHLYFTLKDEKAQVAAVMFRGQNRQLTFSPADGMSVVGLGRIGVYEPRGTYQIILEYLEPAGIGALQIAFERLKQKLADAGLFDERRKRRLPFWPRKIGIVTSPTGAVVHDIITVTGRRCPAIPLEIVAVKVQGPGAEDEICGALALLNQRADCDVIILARGGGSLEDLQAFNSERLAMAIFDSRIPVVDFTIADFVADLRAPTPSAAAEITVPDRLELVRRILETTLKLKNELFNRITKNKKELSTLSARLKHPKRRIQELWLRVDDLQGRLLRLQSAYLRRKKEHLDGIRRRLMHVSPAVQCEKFKIKLIYKIEKLFNSIYKIISMKTSPYREAAARLASLDPMAILRRGYSVTRRLPDQAVVTDPGQVAVDQAIEVMVFRGTIRADVKGVMRHGKEEF